MIASNVQILPTPNIFKREMVVLKNGSQNIYVNISEYCLMLLEYSNGSYLEMFTKMGVSKDSIKACGEYAMHKVKTMGTPVEL